MEKIHLIRHRNARTLLKMVCRGETKTFSSIVNRSPSYVSMYTKESNPKPITDKVADIFERGFRDNGYRVEIGSLSRDSFNQGKDYLIDSTYSKEEKADETVKVDGDFYNMLYGIFADNKNGQERFNHQAIKTLTPDLEVKQNAGVILDLKGLENEIPLSMTRNGALYALSKLFKNAAEDFSHLANKYTKDSFQASQREVESQLTIAGFETIDRDISLPSHDIDSPFSFSTTTQTMLIRSVFEDKHYLVTVAMLGGAPFDLLLNREYWDACRYTHDESLDIRGAYTIILKEDDEFVGDFVPLVFSNEQLSDFDISMPLSKGMQSTETGVSYRRANFNKDWSILLTTGKLQLEKVDVLFGKRRVPIFASHDGEQQSLRQGIMRKFQELKTEPTSLLSGTFSGFLSRQHGDPDSNKDISEFASAYHKIGE